MGTTYDYYKIYILPFKYLDLMSWCAMLFLRSNPLLSWKNFWSYFSVAKLTLKMTGNENISKSILYMKLILILLARIKLYIECNWN